jgi:hypothetical protein
VPLQKLQKRLDEKISKQTYQTKNENPTLRVRVLRAAFVGHEEGSLRALVRFPLYSTFEIVMQGDQNRPQIRISQKETAGGMSGSVVWLTF